MIRCDLCNIQIEGNCWTYATPNTAPDPDTAVGPLYWAEDEEWAVCEDCHQLIQEKNWPQLFWRSVEQQTKQMGMPLTVSMKGEIARVHDMFRRNMSWSQIPYWGTAERMPVEINEEGTR